MKTYLRDQIDWERSFPPEEYAERRAKVRAAMAEAGLDALYVIRRSDLKYLVDYDQIWDTPRMSTGLLIRADTDDTLFFDTSVHTTIISLLPEIKDAVIFGESELGNPSDLDTIVDTLAARGLAKGTSVYNTGDTASTSRWWRRLRPNLKRPARRRSTPPSWSRRSGWSSRPARSPSCARPPPWRTPRSKLCAHRCARA